MPGGILTIPIMGEARDDLDLETRLLRLEERRVLLRVEELVLGADEQRISPSTQSEPAIHSRRDGESIAQ
jgi:hypothetical protein